MAISFSVLPSRTQIFAAPYVSITATDTTDAVSAVSAWNWIFNKTLVSTNSAWSYRFFSSNTVATLYLSAQSPFGNAYSSAVNITILDYPSIASFEVLPGVDLTIGATSRAVTITAQDTSPVISGISAWNWTFNDVTVSNTNNWIYTFFDIITGDIGLTVSGPYGSTTLTDQEFRITDERVNACIKEPVLPIGIKGSTTFNPYITSYNLLGDRIKFQLGWPAVNIEICDDNIYDFIHQAIEWYSKYAGYTEEYLMFDGAKTYEPGLGFKIDNAINAIYKWQTNRCQTSTYNPAVTAQYFDCDLNNYRKVIDVFSLDPVEFTGTDVLFTLDYLFAQQTYFSYLLGSFGFDLITWHILKDWLKLREKLFATKPLVRFDPRTQYLQMTPEPNYQNNFYGVIGCYIERPISQLVQERWVQRYALALTMIALAFIRGKYGQATLFGGANLQSTDLMTMGIKDKELLEKELMESFGEVTPPAFYHG